MLPHLHSSNLLKCFKKDIFLIKFPFLECLTLWFEKIALLWNVLFGLLPRSHLRFLSSYCLKSWNQHFHGTPGLNVLEVFMWWSGLWMLPERKLLPPRSFTAAFLLPLSKASTASPVNISAPRPLCLLFLPCASTWLVHFSQRWVSSGDKGSNVNFLRCIQIPGKQASWS